MVSHSSSCLQTLEISSCLSTYLPFRSRTFELGNKMHSENKLPKWEIRSRRGISLGLSIQHTCNMTLVFKIDIGHVSPPFYLKFDPKFDNGLWTLRTNHLHHYDKGNVGLTSERQVKIDQRISWWRTLPCSTKLEFKLPKNKSNVNPWIILKWLSYCGTWEQV